MKKKLAIALSMLLVLSLALTACGPKEQTTTPPASTSGSGSTSQGEPAPAPAPANLSKITLATGGSSGTYYAVGGVLSSVLGNKAGIEIGVESTGASKANVQGITDGLYNMAILQGDVLAYAHEGSSLFDAVEDSALWVAGIYNETVQIIATPDITDISQLAGKAVVVGDAGSGTEFNARQVLEAYGMDFNSITPQNGSFQDGVDALKDGKVSAAFTVAGAPTTAIVDLAASGTSFAMLSLSEDAVAYLLEHYPFLVPEDLPANTYSGIDYDVTCVAVKAVLVASKDLDEDTVYATTKAMFENLDDLATGHAKFTLLSKDTALDGANVEIHPGALKYYKEIGLA